MLLFSSQKHFPQFTPAIHCFAVLRRTLCTLLLLLLICSSFVPAVPVMYVLYVTFATTLFPEACLPRSSFNSLYKSQVITCLVFFSWWKKCLNKTTPVYKFFRSLGIFPALFRAPNTSNSSLYSSPLLGSALPFFALQSIKTPQTKLSQFLSCIRVEKCFCLQRDTLFRVKKCVISP